MVLVAATTLRSEDKPPAPAANHPTPDAAALKKAAALVEELYASDLKSAKTPEQQKAVAQKFLEAAREESGAGLYVLLTKARDLAIAAGDVEDCDTALAHLESSFEGEPLKARAAAYAGLARNLHAPADRTRLCDDLAAAVQTALAVSQFDLARPDANLGLLLAHNPEDPVLVRHAAADVQRVRDAEAAYGEVKKALLILADKPRDPEANLKAGKYRCFLLGDWKRGLPMLAAGSDATLQALAEQDAAGPAGVEDQVKLGDGWWDVAQKLAGTAKTGAEVHAATWYNDALPQLSGLAKTKVEKRLTELSTLLNGTVPVFLADLPEHEVRVGYGSFGKNGDLGYGGLKIMVGNVLSPHGISMHPPSNGSSHVAYTLTQRYSLFTAAVGIADGRVSTTPLIFRVLGDGKELGHSQPYRGGTPEPCQINITGVTKLELEVECNGIYRSAYAVWIEPMLK
jgi:hypothetical protein